MNFIEFPMPDIKALDERRIAHLAVTMAKKAGTLVPMPCCVCGSTEKIEAHHEDYTKPNVIVWLCLPCHRAHHAAMGSYAGRKPLRFVDVEFDASSLPEIVRKDFEAHAHLARQTPGQLLADLVKEKIAAQTQPSTPIAEAEVSAIELFHHLPPEKRAVVHRYSLMKGQTIVATLKECLLKVSDEINASRETAAHA